MVEFGKAGLVFGLLVALPLAVWVGAMLTREGTPPGRFVDRWFRPLAMAMLFMPMLRRLQRSTEKRDS
jgi:hypothetical protein